MEENKKRVTVEELKYNLLFISTYVAIYENLKASIIENVSTFYNDIGIENGEMVIKKSREYIEEIEGIGHSKNLLKSSFSFLIDMGVFTDNDYALFNKIKKRRNQYVHELYNIVTEPLAVIDAELLSQAMSLVEKLSDKWFRIFEASIQGIDLSDAKEAVISGNVILLNSLISATLLDECEKWDILQEVFLKS